MMRKTAVFGRLESEIRSYCRSFPVVFEQAKGAYLFSECGNRYLDFLSGCGTLNYGHNNEFIKKRIVRYLESDAVTHAMDLFTPAKRRFLEQFEELVLRPGGYAYKLQFPGPTGTNGVEAALKLARKATGRSRVLSFSGAFHGMTLGSLSVSSNPRYRIAAGVDLGDVSFLQFPEETASTPEDFDKIEHEMERVIACDRPACVIIETVQAEGGVNVASASWLRRLAKICQFHRVLLVCDDVQVGCGRTGPFFSFERAGIEPDLVVLSKAIGGYGIPLSLVLIRPEFDRWEPGEHTGTFRANQIALVAATAALEYRNCTNLHRRVLEHGKFMDRFLRGEIEPLCEEVSIRGLGLIWGIDLGRTSDPGLAGRVVRKCFEMGLILETAGHDGRVLKILPPLTIERSELEEGCGVIKFSLEQCLARRALPLASSSSRTRQRPAPTCQGRSRNQ